MATFRQKTLWSLGGIAGYFARRPIVANYERTVQYATDVYIKVWRAIFIMLGVVVLNGVFMWAEWRGAQTNLLLVSLIVGLYYTFAPAIAVPLVSVATAVRAGEPGDQVNVWLMRDGLRDFVNNVGVVFFWIGIYIFTTIIAPFGLYMEFFLFLHIPLILLLMLLMSGKVEVNKKVYEVAWKLVVVLVVSALLAVFTLREHLGPLWVEITASGASKVEASQRSDAIRAIDKAHADWLEKHVRITPEGKQVITVTTLDGKKKEVDAGPYKARRKAERDKAIEALSATSEEFPGEKKKKTPSWVPAWAQDWGPVEWLAGTATGLIVLHILLWSPFVALLTWLGFRVGKGSTDKTSDTKNADKKKESGSGINAKALLILALLGGGGWYGYDNRGPIMDYLGFDGSGTPTGAVVLPSITEQNREEFTAQYGNVNAKIDLPWDLWHGKEVTITHDSSITLRGGVSMMLAFGEGNRTLDLYLADSKCVKVHMGTPYRCEGTWHGRQGNSPREGYFSGSWNNSGTVFTVKLYARNREHHDREILIYKKQK